MKYIKKKHSEAYFLLQNKKLFIASHFSICQFSKLQTVCAILIPLIYQKPKSLFGRRCSAISLVFFLLSIILFLLFIKSYNLSFLKVLIFIVRQILQLIFLLMTFKHFFCFIFYLLFYILKHFN